MSDEDIPSLVAKVVRNSIAADIAAESAGSAAYWNATRAVVEAAREVLPFCHPVPERLRDAIAALDALEKRT